GECPALERLVAQQLKGQAARTVASGTIFQVNFVVQFGFIIVAFAVLVRYDNDLWHVRIMLAPVADARWVIYSPDVDMYTGDVTGVREFRPDGTIPVSLRGANIYIFGAGRAPDQAALRGLMEEAADLVALAGGAVTAAGAVPEVWLFVESNATVAIGDDCMSGPEVVLDQNGLVRSGGDILTVESVPRATVQQWKRARAGTIDVRVMTVKFNPADERFRPRSSAAEATSESAMNHWPVNGATYSNFGYLIHGSLQQWSRKSSSVCSYLEAAGSMHQFGVSNIVVIEKVARRLQTLEYQYAEILRDGERGGAAGAAAGVAGSA
ncbi:unnamed protein product, partial [Prorocentrum cordatum]